MFDDAAAAAHVFGCVICVNNTWAAGTWHLGWCVWVLHACLSILFTGNAACQPRLAKECSNTLMA